MSSGGKNGEDDDDENQTLPRTFSLIFQLCNTTRTKPFAKSLKRAPERSEQICRVRRPSGKTAKEREKHQRSQQNTGGGSGPKELTVRRAQARVSHGCRASHFFDQEGYVVDKNGKRKKNKKVSLFGFIRMEEQFGVEKNGNKKSQKASAAAANERKGAAKPWTASEDALMRHRPRVWFKLGAVADAFGARRA